jgi:hypothetical protein
VPDILSQGGREHGPWPRRMAVVAGLALMAVLIAHYLPRSPHETRKPAQAAVTAAPLPPALSRAASGDAGVAAEPDGITSPILSWPAGLRLPTGGERPAWFSPDTGQVMPIGGLPPQRSGYDFIRAAGGWAVQAAPGKQAVCGSCAGPQRAVYFLADRGRSATRAGLANAVAPGVSGTLWLTSYLPDADPRTTAGVAREVSITGRPAGAQVKLPAGYLIEQGTSRGLLLSPADPQAGTTADKLWDPAAAQASRTFDGVIAASAARIAWVPPCAARCRIQALDLATGRQTSTDLPAASSVTSAALSPDGRSLVVQVSFSDNTANGARAVQLEQVSLASGRLTAVPQTWVSSDALVGFGWAAGGDSPTAGGDSLVAEFSFTTRVQLASWHPGSSRLAIVALRPQHSPAALVIGQHTP